MIHLRNGKFFAHTIEMVFPLMFEQSKIGLPEGIKCDACNFRRPLVNNTNAVKNVVDDLKLIRAITDRCNEGF